MTKYLFVCLCIFPISLFAQKHDYNWVFGYGQNLADTVTLSGGGVMDFRTNPPRLYRKPLRMQFGATSFACSDSSGRLLFYSGGLRIFNHKYKLMEFGDTINPGALWEFFNKRGDYPTIMVHSSIPAPEHPNYYYLFHHSFTMNSDRSLNIFLYYTLIDMNANGGEGRVLKKNQTLLEGDVIQQAIVKHANGRDWWLLTAERSKNVICRFLISASGISGPFKQVVEGPPADSTLEGPGINMFSPDGTRYIRLDVRKGLSIYDFNRCTGELSNWYYIPNRSGVFKAGFPAFSPDSRFLYLGTSGSVVSQLDMEGIPQGRFSVDTIQRFDYFTYPGLIFPVGFDRLALAPDGKIYCSASSSTRWMHVMHRPNLPGKSCDMENHGLLLPRYNDFSIGIYPNYRLGVWEGSPCDTLGRHPSDSAFVKTSYEAFLERQAAYRAAAPARQPLTPEPLHNEEKPVTHPLERMQWRLFNATDSKNE